MTSSGQARHSDMCRKKKPLKHTKNLGLEKDRHGIKWAMPYRSPERRKKRKKEADFIPLKEYSLSNYSNTPSGNREGEQAGDWRKLRHHISLIDPRIQARLSGPNLIPLQQSALSPGLKES